MREDITRCFVISVRLLLQSLSLLLFLGEPGHAVTADSGEVAQIAYGPVRGEAEGGVTVFRGIPYAEAPIGALRFRRLQPPRPWTVIRPALDFAPACPQVFDPDFTENNQLVQSEDCLAVNVWTPNADHQKRPVMVWIHGGSFISGSARNTWYDGTQLARRGDVVVVTIQYRLGALGFLDLSALGGPAYAASANLGLLDEVDALKWVQQNIGAFGGDPHNVTVFGESAGGISAALLMVLPEARGLFAKVIIESGAPVFGQSTASSAKVTQAFMKSAGVHDIAGLQALTMAQVIESQRKLFDTGTGDGSFALATDGTVLKGNGMALIERGDAARVPVLIGTNLDESQYFEVVVDVGQARKPPQLLDQQLIAAFGSHAPTIKNAYFQGDSHAYGRHVIELNTDVIARMPTTRFVEALHDRQPVWLYLFNYQSTSTYRPFMAAHGMELPFVFGNLSAQDVIAFTGRDPDRERLSTQMQDAWIAFARSGDPNSAGLPRWPRYDLHDRATMTFGKHTELVHDPLPERRKAWDGIPFDGQTPTPAQLSGFLFDNGAH